KKLRKMDYIIKLGADVNVRHEFGYSVLGLAKLIQNEDVIKFFEERGAEDIGFDSIKAEEFFKSASVEEINKVLKVLPDGYKLNCCVDLSKRDLTELPDFSKVVIKGDFYCGVNQLESLEGAPREVTGVFYCYGNQLTTLEGAPSIVGGDFDCHNNQLTSLKGAPSEVGEDFDCYGNQLISLEGSPSIVGRGFYCFDNQLISLEGSPSIVGRGFYCYDNPLKSYKGKPDKIGGKFVAPDIEQINNINGGNSR
ncbi:MAG: hypothetical protein IJZ30_03430, partial [Alphaproteobacteria bacterium]|nr:hypothetical protein [Alphaproteobacteria bacterium]